MIVVAINTSMQYIRIILNLILRTQRIDRLYKAGKDKHNSQAETTNIQPKPNYLMLLVILQIQV